MTKNRHPTQPMTPDHPRWHTFIARLSGPEGCHFREDETGNLIWDCKSGQDKSKATAILKTMPDIDLEASLAYFDQHGGYCDCEIVFNVDMDQAHEANFLASSPPPAWMDTLVEIVANCLEVNSPMGPLGYRYLDEADLTELLVYPTPVELIGGEHDGEVVLAGFSLDLQALLAAFEQVDAAHWSVRPFGPPDLEGPYLSIEGRYQGHNVWLRVLSDPPEDEAPGMKLDTLNG